MTEPNEADDDLEAPPGSSPAVESYLRARRTLATEWDAIVVGAGIGGLVSAGLLAQAGMRVVLLERHHAPGGLSQSFRRPGWQWDAGVHYVGEVAPGAPLRRLFDSLGDGAIDWAPLPHLHDRLLAPDGELRLGGDAATLGAAFAREHPDEAHVIERYFEEVRACARASLGIFLTRMRPGRDDAKSERSPFFRWADATTTETLARLGASSRLAALLTYNWGNYATPPDESSFAAHAIATAHYFGGGRTPIGGGDALSRALGAGLVRRGGRLLVRAEVDEILVKEARTVGVRLMDGRELRAGVVVSDAGARTTCERLLPSSVPGAEAMRARVATIGPSWAHLGLYLGLRGTPEALGLGGENLWITELARGRARAFADPDWVDDPSGPGRMYVSTASVNDPTLPERMPGRVAITGTTLVPYAPFARWEGSRWGRRDAEYDVLKKKLATRLVEVLAPHAPLAVAAIEHVELSTPLSTRHFAGHPSGEAAGLAHTPARFRLGPFPHGPVPGLFFSGQDVWLCGIAGAAFGGLLAASTVLRRDLISTLR